MAERQVSKAYNAKTDGGPKEKQEPVAGCESVEGQKKCQRRKEYAVFHSLADRKRKGFTTPLLAEANKRRNAQQFTKKKPRCQRGGARGAANQNVSPKAVDAANQTTLQ